MIELWRECSYLFLCLCYSRGLPENLKRVLFLACIHVVIVAWHYLQLQCFFFCVSSKQFGKSGGERSARRCVFCNNNAVENHGCPVKMNAASLSKRIYSLISRSGNGMSSLFTTNHFILKIKVPF